MFLRPRPFKLNQQGPVATFTLAHTRLRAGVRAGTRAAADRESVLIITLVRRRARVREEMRPADTACDKLSVYQQISFPNLPPPDPPATRRTFFRSIVHAHWSASARGFRSFADARLAVPPALCRSFGPGCVLIYAGGDTAAAPAEPKRAIARSCNKVMGCSAAAFRFLPRKSRWLQVF